jgi:YidC/Oxa1 family membrane protein insertase
MDKNSIIGFVLIGCILFGFSWFQSKEYNKQLEIQAQADSIARVEQAAAMALDSIQRAQNPQADAAAPLNIYKDSLLSVAAAKSGKIVTLSNEKIEIAFNTRGAQPYSVKINDYKTYDSTDLYLLKPQHGELGINIFAGENLNTKDFVFDVAHVDASSIVMRLPFANGGYIEQKYVLEEDSYMVKNSLKFVNMNIPRNVSSYDYDFTMVIPRMEKGYKNEVQYSKVNYYFDGESKPETVGKGRSGSENIDAKLKWFAFQQQFFSVIVNNKSQFASGALAVNFYEEGDENRNLMKCSAKMRGEFENSNNIEVEYDYYFGPNDYTILKKFDEKYEKIIPLGGSLVAWINRILIIPSFDIIGRFISNYGLVILIMTILLKLLISPLTIKSYMSSAKMACLKPEIEAINQKYPNEKDAMKKQQATMDLYRKAGVSPMGGCLPMLLQFPILFAMFRFFPASIELRQQSFLWADDLSAYDSILDLPFSIPLYGDHVSLFALLMAVTMFFYSRMTSSQMSDDPNMAGMKFMSLYMMPIMMLFICNNLSSALSYYYLLSNLITMVQTWVIKKYFVSEDKLRLQIAAASKKPSKKSKWQLRLEEMQKMQEAQMKNRK